MSKTSLVAVVVNRKKDKEEQMKRAVAIALALGLIVGSVSAPAFAKRKKGKKKRTASVTRKYFLRRADCGGKDKLRLSVKNGPDTACADMQAGLLGDLIHETGASNTWVSYPAVDGVPFALNTKKPITGEITLYASGCAAEEACAPEGGLGAGNATLRLAVVGKTKRGKERTLGEVEEPFLITPMEPTYTSSFKTWPDEFFQGDRFVGLRLDVQVGGPSYGPGGISYDDPASFIQVPTLRR